MLHSMGSLRVGNNSATEQQRNARFPGIVVIAFNSFQPVSLWLILLKILLLGLICHSHQKLKSGSQATGLSQIMY